MSETNSAVQVELTHQEIDVLLRALNEAQGRAGGAGSGSTPAEIRPIRDKLNAAIRARPIDQ